MRLLLLAPPGAGKGTQAEGLAARYALTDISSGELLREHIAGDPDRTARGGRAGGR